MSSKLTPLKAFTMEVRAAVTARYVEFFEENLGPLTTLEKERLRKGISLVFMSKEVFEKVEEAFESKTEVESIVQRLFVGSTIEKAVKAVWGFKKKYELAQMMSSARYACSPESEAYWAS